MEEILLKLVDELNDLNNEEERLGKLFKEYYIGFIKKKNLSKEDEEFQMLLIDNIIEGNDNFTFNSYFKPNPLIQHLYAENQKQVIVIHRYALQLYKLYKKESNQQIPYYEDIVQKEKKLQGQKFLDTSEFELLFGYSKSSQTSFRQKINNPLPIDSEYDSGKIRYIREEAERWLRKCKKLKSK